MKAILIPALVCLTLSLSAQIAVGSTELELRAVRMELSQLKQSYRQLKDEKISDARNRDAARLRKRQDGLAWFLIGAGCMAVASIASGGYRAIYLNNR